MYSHFGGAEVIALRYPEIEAAVRESVDGVLRAPANGASEGDFANAAIAISAELYQRDFLPREVNVEASLRGSSLSLAGLMFADVVVAAGARLHFGVPSDQCVDGVSHRIFDVLHSRIVISRSF